MQKCLMSQCHCRELQRLTLPGTGIATAITVGLSVAWSGASSPTAADFNFDLPYQVSFALFIRSSCACLWLVKSQQNSSIVFVWLAGCCTMRSCSTWANTLLVLWEYFQHLTMCRDGCCKTCCTCCVFCCCRPFCTLCASFRAMHHLLRASAMIWRMYMSTAEPHTKWRAALSTGCRAYMELPKAECEWP